MKSLLRTSISAAMLLLATAGLAGPPALVITGMGLGDLSGDGNTAVGSIYNAAIDQSIVFRFTRGAVALSTGSNIQEGVITCSSNGSVLSWGTFDLENLAGLGTDGYTPHRWTLSTGSVNAGTFSGGTRCGGSISAANDTSGNGRYLVGAGWSDSECGPYRAWRYDSTTSSFEILPFSVSPPPFNAPAINTRADSVSGDGSVVCGYDENYEPTLSFTTRRAAVWTKNAGVWTETVLDEYGGDANAVSTDGSTVVGKMSSETMMATFGTDVTSPVRWVRVGASWVPQNLGGDGSNSARLVSGDGSTVLGNGGFFGGFPFIWRADLNEGVTMNFSAYLTSIGATFPGFSVGSFFGSPFRAVSDDGNALSVSGFDNRSAACLSTGASAILYLNGTPSCEPAGINFGPVSHFDPVGPAGFSFIFNTFAKGTWEMNYQWQKETVPGSGVWAALSDDNCGEFDPQFFNYKGSSTSQLRLGALDGTWAGRYRCVVSNACGSEATSAFKAAGCAADFNFDGFVTGDDFDAFVEAFELGTNVADFDDNGFVTGDDFDAYVAAFEAGC